jgi:addiction module RelE/StbE family toxin
MKLFSNEPFAIQLRNHQLKGRPSGFRSISTGGDIRLHYYEKEPNYAIVVFVAVGSHAQFY